MLGLPSHLGHPRTGQDPGGSLGPVPDAGEVERDGGGEGGEGLGSGGRAGNEGEEGSGRGEREEGPQLMCMVV